MAGREGCENVDTLTLEDRLIETGGLYCLEPLVHPKIVILITFAFLLPVSVIPCKLTSVGGLGIWIPTNAIDVISDISICLSIPDLFIRTFSR